MELELSLSNEPRALPSVKAFLHTTLLQLPLPGDGCERLGELVTAAVEDTIDKAYPPGENGLIKLTIRELAGKLEIRIRDFGLPQDVKVLQKQWDADESTVARLHGRHAAELVDHIHWIAYGPHGKALQLIKWLHTANIADTSSAKELARVPADVPLAPEQEYAVRRMLPEEAVQISQLMYRTYGNTYFNQDVYFPDRIAAQNLHDVLLSVVSVGEDGQLAGHCALERNQDGPVAEIGEAAVDPAHRSRGLLDRMKAALEKEAQRLGLVGWFADAVAVHIFTQQSNAHHGGHVCGVDLAVSPKSEAFRNIANEQSQRVSCVVYFHWLEPPKQRTIFVPSRHREIVDAIYENLACPVEFGKPSSATQEHGTLTVKFERRGGLATIRAEQLGKDSAIAIRHATRELVEKSHAKVVLAELPLADPAAAEICEALEADGFGFTGIGPHFLPHSDVLKMAYLVEPLAREPIKTFEPIADRIVEYALAEQVRVRAAL